MDKKKKATNGNLKQVEEVLKAFLELEKDDAPFDELFQKIKLLYDSMKGIEKEELFKAIIEQLEVRKGEIVRLVGTLKCYVYTRAGVPPIAGVTFKPTVPDLTVGHLLA